MDELGELTVYDVAHRIGAYLQLEPDVVYLHRGTRIGARYLGLRLAVHVGNRGKIRLIAERAVPLTKIKAGRSAVT